MVATSFESTLIDFKIVVTLISESIHIAVQKQLILNFVGAVINFIQLSVLIFRYCIFDFMSPNKLNC